MPFIPAHKSRNKRAVSGVAAWLVLVALTIGAVPAAARSTPDGFADLAQRLLPAVVNISSSQTLKADRVHKGSQQLPDMPQLPPGLDEFFRNFMDREQQQGQQQQPGEDQPARHAVSLGSGFVIDPSGLIVTNNHVIDSADEITVTLQDNTTFKATLVGKDAKTDLALLKVETKKPLTAVTWGDSDKSRVGDWVVAIGDPFGLGGTVTAGILSARQRDIGNGPYDDFLQTDASINKGNSGGPMFNIDGEVIGINTAIFSPSGGSVGIGFAIPSSMAQPVIEQLKATGKVKRGWLGVKIQSVSDDLADSLGLDKASGALVANVQDGSPAAKAGVVTGDVILRYDDKPVTEMRRLPRLVAETPINRTVDVVVWRKRHESTVKVTIAELTDGDQVASAADGKNDTGKAGKPVAKVSALGLDLAPLTPQLRDKFGLNDNASGVVVTDVAVNSAAGERGIQAGDLIVTVDEQEVKSPSEVAARIKDAKDAKKKLVAFLIDKKGDMHFVAVRLDGKS